MSEPPPGPPAEPEPPVPEHRLDPDRSVAAAGVPAAPEPAPAIDTRPYRWMVGIFGLALVVAISVYQLASKGVGTAGVPPGKHLHYFVAPLASGGLNGDSNLNPRCDPAHPLPQALNVCGRTPVVLGFFVTGSDTCKREVDTIQALSRRFSSSDVHFAAIAVRAGHAETSKAVRSHHWTIPVAYDRDGAVGEVYGAEICPMVELAYRGGIVSDRLIGEHWQGSADLAARVRKLAEQ